MTKYKQAVKLLKMHIKKNIHNGINVKSFTDCHNLNQSQLSQAFRRAYDKTIRKDVNEHRKRLFQKLLENEFTIKSYCAASKLGFKNE